MVKFSAKMPSIAARYLGCVLAVLFAAQGIAAAQLSGNGNFVVPLSDPQVSLSGPVFTNGQFQFILNCEPGLSYVIERSPDFANWTPIATNNDFGIRRTITVPESDAGRFYRASRSPQTLFAFAAAARGNIALAGNGLTTDSFNSSDPAYSTNGIYDPSRTRSNGTIAIASGIIDLGNHVIGGNLSLGSGVTVTWTTNRQVLGFVFTNRLLQFPDVVLPSASWLPSPLSNSVHDFTTSGYYLIEDGSSLEVEPGVTVVLNVTTPSFGSGIRIHGGITNSGTAYLFLSGCTNATLFRNDADDASNRAKNLCFFGLPTLATITPYSASTTNFPCVIYAPSASAILNGGGITGGISGAFVAGTISLNGHIAFHFDEDLLNSGPFR